jgi:hypothetical protein
MERSLASDQHELLVSMNRSWLGQPSSEKRKLITPVKSSGIIGPGIFLWSCSQTFGNNFKPDPSLTMKWYHLWPFCSTSKTIDEFVQKVLEHDTAIQMLLTPLSSELHKRSSRSGSNLPQSDENSSRHSFCTATWVTSDFSKLNAYQTAAFLCFSMLSCNWVVLFEKFHGGAIS